MFFIKVFRLSDDKFVAELCIPDGRVARCPRVVKPSYSEAVNLAKDFHQTLLETIVEHSPLSMRELRVLFKPPFVYEDGEVRWPDVDDFYTEKVTIHGIRYIAFDISKQCRQDF